MVSINIPGLDGEAGLSVVCSCLHMHLQINYLYHYAIDTNIELGIGEMGNESE